MAIFLPANVFVSQSLEYAEVWLIDADNVASQSHDGQQGVYSPPITGLQRF